ncbi:MAG: 4'-phosphopantetheinyl transferase family protein [Burkholderiales bacterium]
MKSDHGRMVRQGEGSLWLHATIDVEVVSFRLDAGPATVRASAAVLAEDERERARRFVCDHARRRFIIARARLRRLLAARLAVRPESVALVYGKHGKPALAPALADSGLRFNLSHAGDFAVYAFSTSGEVGVDIEQVRAIQDADQVAAHAFSRRENECYRNLDARRRPLAFFRCWTRKEAFVKALGAGLSYPLGGFDVSLAPAEAARILRVGRTPGDRCGWTLRSFVPGPGLTGAVVHGAGE